MSNFLIRLLVGHYSAKDAGKISVFLQAEDRKSLRTGVSVYQEWTR